ncbi:hypothetical protein Avbf_18220, partial [Armadillidium vulgare]
VQNFLRKNENLFQLISEKSGRKITSLGDLYLLSRNLEAEVGSIFLSKNINISNEFESSLDCINEDAVEKTKFKEKVKRSYNLTLPSWAVQNYQEISTAGHLWYQYYSYFNEMKRLKVGPVFGLLTENIRKKSIGEIPEQKMFMYSYNGIYIATMLNTMGVFNGIEIPYISSLIFELHQTDKNYFVK